MKISVFSSGPNYNNIRKIVSPSKDKIVERVKALDGYKHTELIIWYDDINFIAMQVGKPKDTDLYFCKVVNGYEDYERIPKKTCSNEMSIDVFTSSSIKIDISQLIDYDTLIKAIEYFIKNGYETDLVEWVDI